MSLPPLFPVLACLAGLILGSFYTVCIHRALTGGSLLSPARSQCPHCAHVLAWWENIPLVSYILLRGRCKQCQQHISFCYPAVELLSAGIALALALKFGLGVQWFVYMAFSGLFIVQSALDLASMYMLLYPLIAGAVAALVCAPLFLGIPLSEAVLSAVAGGGTFWLIRWLYRRFRGIEGLGEGDIWLMLVIAPLVGARQLPLVFVLSGIGLIVCSVLLLRYSPRQPEQEDEPAAGILHTRLPYGPFLCAAALLVILTGKELMQWYIAWATAL